MTSQKKLTLCPIPKSWHQKFNQKKALNNKTNRACWQQPGDLNINRLLHNKPENIHEYEHTT
jgi:hypothetical protein